MSNVATAATRLAVLAGMLVMSSCRSGNEQRPGGHPTDVSRAAEQQKRTVDPNGEYDLTFTDDGMVRSATMVVTGTPGTYAGRIKAENRPEAVFTAIAASGPQVIATADVPNGVLLLRFRMTGDSLRGDWSLRGDGGRLSGVRRTGASK
jgi:hypothetical protein